MQIYLDLAAQYILQKVKLEKAIKDMEEEIKDKEEIEEEIDGKKEAENEENRIKEIESLIKDLEDSKDEIEEEIDEQKQIKKNWRIRRHL